MITEVSILVGEKARHVGSSFSRYRVTPLTKATSESNSQAETTNRKPPPMVKAIGDYISQMSVPKCLPLLLYRPFIP
ncbi:hypothetical protein IH992_05105 [Candidatus Poribacteria bacterium]|nr:hypothetical protein [Candidatus Poribacteria bacterium]